MENNTIGGKESFVADFFTTITTQLVTVHGLSRKRFFCCANETGAG